jgi:hypothetical protein
VCGNRSILVVIAALATGCGGRALVGAADAGEGASEAAAPSPTPSSSSSVPPPQSDCQERQTQLTNIQDILRKCCPTCQGECTQSIEGVCCPFTVSPTANSTAVMAYEQAMQAFKASCPVACPASPCPAAPSNSCNPSTSVCQ